MTIKVTEEGQFTFESKEQAQDVAVVLDWMAKEAERQGGSWSHRALREFADFLREKIPVRGIEVFQDS